MISGYYLSDWLCFQIKELLKFLSKATEIKLDLGYIPHIPPQRIPKHISAREQEQKTSCGWTMDAGLNSPCGWKMFLKHPSFPMKLCLEELCSTKHLTQINNPGPKIITFDNLTLKTWLITMIILACLKLDIACFGDELSSTCIFFLWNVILLLGPVKYLYVRTIIEEIRHMNLKLCMQQPASLNESSQETECYFRPSLIYFCFKPHISTSLTSRNAVHKLQLLHLSHLTFCFCFHSKAYHTFPSKCFPGSYDYLMVSDDHFWYQRRHFRKLNK